MKYLNMIEPSPVQSHIIDVGANKGMFTRKALERFPNCRFHLFEPVPHLTRKIIREDPRVSMNVMGVSNRTMQGLPLDIRQGFTANTFSHVVADGLLAQAGAVALPPVVENIRADVVRLDEYCTAAQITEIFFLKIDAEGMGLAVLEGCGVLLRTTQWIGVEMQVTPVFAGDAASDIAQFLRAHGFRRFVDVYAHYDAATGALVGVDALWENPHHTIAANDFYQLDEKNAAFRTFAPCD